MMNRNFKRISRYLSVFCLVLMIIFTFSISFVVNASSHDLDDPPGTPDTPFTFQNPLKADYNTVESFIGAILDIVVKVGVSLVTLMIIWAGFLFVTAQGSDEKLITARKAFTYAIIGAAIVLGAFVIEKALQGTVDQLTNEETT